MIPVGAVGPQARTVSWSEHAFVDGNKRAGFLACGVFLAINGKALCAEPADAIAAVLALAEGSIGEREFAAWIRYNWRSA